MHHPWSKGTSQQIYGVAMILYFIFLGTFCTAKRCVSEIYRTKMFWAGPTARPPDRPTDRPTAPFRWAKIKYLAAIKGLKILKKTFFFPMIFQRNTGFNTNHFYGFFLNRVVSSSLQSGFLRRHVLLCSYQGCIPPQIWPFYGKLWTQ